MGTSIDNCIAELNEHADLLRNAATELCKYQRFKSQCEARLKADMVAMLTEIQLEIDAESWGKQFEGLEKAVDMVDVNMIIQRKINVLKADSEDKE